MSFGFAGNSMKHIFFDIDGTLLLSGGAGRVAMTRVMTRMFGVENLVKLDVSGRTDRAIIRDLFAAHDVSWSEDVYREFANHYHQELATCIARCNGRLLSGVLPLLEALAAHPRISLGLLTGNSQDGAMIKVRHYRIDHYFRFGGFGSEHECRNDVARAALADCRRWAAPAEVAGENAWVVGDTVHDVRCGQAIGARIVGVATGGTGKAELISAGADLVIDSFDDAKQLFSVFLDT
jgi:phosphoglycolate phosphatase